MLHARLLRYLDEVARCQSMRLAGERLNVAGSAINRQILTLEEQLGTKLFERQPHRVILTSSGEVLIDHVRKTLRGMDATVSQIEALKGLQWGDVSIGVASGIAGAIMPVIVDRVRQTLARVKLNIRIMSASDIVSTIAVGDIDLGLAFNLPTAGLYLINRRPVSLGAVVAPNHPLAAKMSVTLGECASYPLCVAKAPLTLSGQLEAAFADASVLLAPAVETDSIELMRCLALDGSFVTFLSPFDIYRESRAGLLVHIPVSSILDHKETLVFLGPKKGMSPIAARVAQVVEQVVAEV
jgi:DNA-binding transcriptional LysR family regulator